MPGNWTIERYTFPIAALGGVGNHNFLVLKDGNGNVVRELNGRAEGPKAR